MTFPVVVFFHKTIKSMGGGGSGKENFVKNEKEHLKKKSRDLKTR